MKRSLIQIFVMIAAIVLLIGAGAFGISLVAKAANPNVALSDQTVPLISQAKLKGAANSQQMLDLSIGLQLRNQDGLTNLLHDLYTPTSPRFHRFLTPQQFSAEFAPTADQQQQVIDFLRGHGLTVTGVAPNGLLIDARASVATIQSAFGVQINTYQMGARTFYANANPPLIPSSLSPLILSIGGLDNSTLLHPMSHVTAPKEQAQHAKKTAPPEIPAASYGPKDLVGAYDATPLHQSNLLGKNQTVAVFELDGFQQGDIDQFAQNNNLGKLDISTVKVGGFNGSAGQGAIEVELDIEVIAEMAPQASQIVYEGPNTTQGVNNTYNRIVVDNKAQIVSTSWGLCEAQSGNSELQTLDAIFKQAAAQGITIFAASGDSGAYDCNNNNLAVDSPAGDPYVTGVGGTNLQISNSAYGSESVWSNPTDTQRSPKGAGGGGGLSSFFTLPEWQSAPGVQNKFSNGKREVPDVAADADPATGYAIICTVAASGCPSSGNVTVGGTSAAAPLWAGSMALINQYLQQQGKSRVGFASPHLYTLASAKQPFPPFHDVTSGDNLFYPATANYDLATGLGTPDIYNIARDLANSPQPTPSPTPTPPGGSPTPGPSPTTTPPSPTPTSTSSPVPPPPGGALLQNGGFEDGTQFWQESSSHGYELIDDTNPHSGQYGAYLCGYSSCNDVLSQSFTVPSKPGKVTVSYWWEGDTNRTAQGCKDTFTVQLLDSSGKVIAKIQQSCNTNANGQWRQVKFDLSKALAQQGGKTVTLVFSSHTTSSKVTSAFFVDDIAITNR